MLHKYHIVELHTYLGAGAAPLAKGWGIPVEGPLRYYFH